MLSVNMIDDKNVFSFIRQFDLFRNECSKLSYLTQHIQYHRCPRYGIYIIISDMMCPSVILMAQLFNVLCLPIHSDVYVCNLQSAMCKEGDRSRYIILSMTFESS